MTDPLDSPTSKVAGGDVDPAEETERNRSSSDLFETQPEESAEDRWKKFRRFVGKMAKMMAPGGALGTGDLAELRRISPEKPFTPALWRLLLALGEAEPWGGLERNVYERRMATLTMGMAFCAGLHDYNVPLGRALAQAGWSELRFVRLMEARGETLEKLVRRMSQFLASKSQPANWVDVGQLLIAQDWKNAEEIRLEISRSYYRTLHAQTQDQE